MAFRFSLILFFLQASWFLGAQSVDRSSNVSVDLMDSLLLCVSLTDSVSQKSLQTLDSIHIAATTSFHSYKLSYDSINTVANKASLDVQQHIDSLSLLNSPSGKWMGKLDSIDQWRDERLKTIQARVDTLKRKVHENIASLNFPEELKTHTDQFTSMVDKLDVTLPASSFPEFNLGNDLQSVENLLPTAGMSGSSLPGLPDIPGVNVNSFELPGVIDQFNSIPSQIPTSAGDISSAIEKQAGEITTLTDVQDKIGEMSQLNEVTGNLNNPEAVKQKLKEEVQQQAVDYFAGKENELQSAMELVSKYKKKYGSFQGLEDLKRKKPNEMRGKPLVERLLPGLAIQLQQREVWLFDFNPYLGYKFNGRLTVGAGWNQRIAFNFDENTFHQELNIFGPRAYGEYKISEGLKACLETEYMNTTVPPTYSTGKADPDGKEWVFSAMAGVKKDYRFFKNLRGTAMVLYNLYDPDHRSPYAERLIMRFGFEFPMRKKVRQRNADESQTIHQ